MANKKGDGKGLSDLVSELSISTIKLIDKSILLEAPSTALEPHTFVKGGEKKVMLITTEEVLDYIPLNLERRSKGDPSLVRHTENSEVLSSVLSDLKYDKQVTGLAKISENKWVYVIPKENDPVSLPPEGLKSEIGYRKYIFDVARQIRDKVPKMDFELVTLDSHILSKSRRHGVEANPWHDVSVGSISQLHFGWRSWIAHGFDFDDEKDAEVLSGHVLSPQSDEQMQKLLKIMDKLGKQGYLDPREIEDLDGKKLKPNEIIFIDQYAGKELFNLRLDPYQSRVIKWNHPQRIQELFTSQSVHFGAIKPQNRFQRATFEILMSGADLSFVWGGHGTGKSVVTYGFGWQLLNEPMRHVSEDHIRKLFPDYNPEIGMKKSSNRFTDYIVVFRPLQELGDTMGFLPGGQSEKMEPIARPVYKNLKQVIGSRDDQKLEEMMEKKVINVNPVNFETGDTHAFTTIIADEMQNYSIDQLFYLPTRITGSSKIVFNGDPIQSMRRGERVYYNALIAMNKMLFLNPKVPMAPWMACLYIPVSENVRGVVSREIGKYQ
jgi:hypothetical protein